MSSPEANIETLVSAILQDALASATIRTGEEDTDTVSVHNRINVDCAPKTPLAPARSSNRTPIFWQAQVTITAQSHDTASAFDAWRDAIDDAINPANNTYPASVVTTALSLFPNGVEIGQLEGGDITQDSKARTLTRSFRAVFKL